jgi:hypothetical protein
MTTLAFLTRPGWSDATVRDTVRRANGGNDEH